MKILFDSEDIKGIFFLTTLLEAMNNIINNLSSRDITRFTNIETKILDLANRHNVAE